MSEVDLAASYGVPAFVVEDAVWDQIAPKDSNGNPAPAFATGGQIYFQQSMPEMARGVYARHELTHVMRETGFQPYLDFLTNLPQMVNTSSEHLKSILDHVADHRGIDQDNMTSDQETILWDEFASSVYGSAADAANIPAQVYDAFLDLDAFLAEMDDIHRQFRESHQGNIPMDAPGNDTLTIDPDEGTQVPPGGGLVLGGIQFFAEPGMTEGDFEITGGRLNRVVQRATEVVNDALAERALTRDEVQSAVSSMLEQEFHMDRRASTNLAQRFGAQYQAVMVGQHLLEQAGSAADRRHSRRRIFSRQTWARDGSRSFAALRITEKSLGMTGGRPGGWAPALRYDKKRGCCGCCRNSPCM